MIDFKIKKISSLGELTLEEVELWRSFLTNVNDPRTVFQQPELLFNLPNIENRIYGIINYVVFSEGKIIGIFSFKKQVVNKVLKFGHLTILTKKVDEIRSFGCGKLLEIPLDGQDDIKNTIVDLLKKETLQNDSYVFLEAIEEYDLLYSFQEKRFTQFHLDESDTYLMYFETDFDAFLKARSKSKRNSIKKDLRRFEREYEGRFAIKIGPVDVSAEEFINKANLILNRSWKKGIIGSIVGSSNFSRQLEILNEFGLVKTFVLEVDNAPVAFAIGYYSEQNFFYEEIAYDENFAKSGVGSYLTISAIKLLHQKIQLNESGTKPIFSFGVGDNIYKRKLYSYKLKSKNLMLCKPSSQIKLFFQTKVVFDYCYKSIRQGLIKLDLHTALRRRFKQRLQNKD